MRAFTSPSSPLGVSRPRFFSPCRLLVSAIVALALHPAASARTERGSGELSLDRDAVATIIAVGLPRERTLQLPVGKVTLVLTPPARIRFLDGGIEGELGVAAKELGLSGSFSLRFVPRMEGDEVVLDLVRASPVGPAGMLPDLASLIAPIAVPSAYAWALPLQNGESRDVKVSVVDVFVTNERLLIQWQLSAATSNRP